MKDLYTNVVLHVSNLEAVALYTNSGEPGGMGMAPVDQSKVFVPTNDMSMTELAEVLAVYINVKLSGQKMTPEEFDALPASVRRFFRDQ